MVGDSESPPIEDTAVSFVSVSHKRGVDDGDILRDELMAGGKRHQGITGCATPTTTETSTGTIAPGSSVTSLSNHVPVSSDGTDPVHAVYHAPTSTPPVATSVSDLTASENVPYVETASLTKEPTQPNSVSLSHQENSNSTSLASSPSPAIITITNVSEDTAEADVASLLGPFVGFDSSRLHCVFSSTPGTVQVTMPDKDSAERATQYLITHSPQIKGRPVRIDVTPEIILPETPKPSSKGDHPSESRVLFVTVTRITRYPVDIDLLYRVFCRYGTVEKIILFPKPPGRCQSLIQFSSLIEAKTASAALNHRDIYDGCNTLQIDFSRLPELVVNGNTSRSWDFLLAPALPDYQAHTQGYGMPATPSVGCLPAATSSFSPYRWPTGILVDPSVVQQQQQAQRLPQKMQETAPGLYPDSTSSGSFFPSPNLYSNPATVQPDPFIRHLTRGVLEKLPQELQNIKQLRQINPKQTSVIICYNLPAGDITTAKLFNLFSIYGVVERIKLLRGKENTALIQFSDPFFATLACYFLQGAPFFGVEGGLQIEMSRNFEVKLATVNSTNSTEAAEEAKRASAFFLKDQRCNRDEVEKIVRGACKPTATLFISNVHDSVQEEMLRELISTVGTVSKLKLKRPAGVGKKATAVAEMTTEREAVSAICHLHNHKLAQCNLKFAFTKQILTD